MRFISPTPFLFLFLFLFLSSFQHAVAQKEISLEKVKDHTGDSVTVKGKVFGIRYLEGARNAPTFINVGGAFPNQLLTVVIWGDVRKKFELDLSDKKFASAMAVVTGKIELYKDKPQIVITDPKQLTFIYDEEVPQGALPPVKQ